MDLKPPPVAATPPLDVAQAVHFLSCEELCEWATTHKQENVRSCSDLLERHRCDSATVLHPAAFTDLTSPDIGFTRLQARALVNALHLEQRLACGPVGVFWDAENVSITTKASPDDVIAKLRSALARFGRIKDSIRVYGEYDGALVRFGPLSARGCTLRHTPHIGGKDVADRAILVDLMLFAMDHPPPSTLVLISGDSDFSNVLSILRDRGYRVLLIYPQLVTRPALRQSAEIALQWELDILGLSKRTTPPADSSAALSSPAVPVKTQQPQVGFHLVRSTGSPLSLPVIRSPLVGREAERKDESKGPSPPVSGPELSAFTDLIDVLNALHQETGETQLPYTQVGTHLLRKNPNIYKRNDGYRAFGVYALAAKERHIVRIGGTKGSGKEWVELLPPYRRFSAEAESAAFEERECLAPPAAKGAVDTNATHASSGDVPLRASLPSSASLSRPASPVEIPWSCFEGVIIDTLQQLELTTGRRQLQRFKEFGAKLKHDHPLLLQGDTSLSFNRLVKAAEKWGIVELGGEGTESWIQLQVLHRTHGAGYNSSPSQTSLHTPLPRVLAETVPSPMQPSSVETCAPDADMEATVADEAKQVLLE